MAQESKRMVSDTHTKEAGDRAPNWLKLLAKVLPTPLALGAGGRRFKSSRPDQRKISPLFPMPIFGHLLVLVAFYCFLVALEALSIYKIIYSGRRPKWIRV